VSTSSKYRRTYRNLKVYKLIGERGHRIIETEAVLADLIRREHVIALSFLLAIQDHFLLA